ACRPSTSTCASNSRPRSSRSPTLAPASRGHNGSVCALRVPDGMRNDRAMSTPVAGTGARSKNLVLAAMVFAVAMTFIDQTIVAIAIPNIQKELSLTPTGAQWVINGYLLALSALFAFGGKLGDVLGRKRMVLIGVSGFAIASAACGLTPKGSIAEVW